MSQMIPSNASKQLRPLMKMWFLMAILTAFMFGLSSFLIKLGTIKGSSIDHLLVGFHISGALGFIGFIFIHSEFTIEVTLLIAALVVGIASILGNTYYVKALHYGPTGLTTALTNLNVVLVVAMSIAFYGENLNLLKLITIIILFFSICLIPLKLSRNTFTILSSKWYTYIQHTHHISY